MRVVYYTLPCYFHAALPLIRELSHLVELHLVLELSPETWASGAFDVPPMRMSEGITLGDPVLKDCFPERVREYWSNCASFNMVVHTYPRLIHPRTWLVSRKAARFIRELKPDVLQLDTDGTSRLAWAMRDIRGIPVVVGIHDPEAHSGEGNWRTGLARRLTFPHVNRFILHNEAMRDSFRQRYRVPEAAVDVVPLGVLSVFREWIDEEMPEDERTVLFFGRMSKYKGLDVLYKVAPLVAAEVPGVRFIVAGRTMAGYTLPPLPTLSNGATMELIDRYVSNSEAASLFQRASLVVCPYVDATQSAVVLTAYAFGKPVVASRVGGLPEYVTDGVSGLLVPPGDVDGLAVALEEVLHDGRVLERLRLGVRRLVDDRLNWSRLGSDTLRSYQAALAL